MGLQDKINEIRRKPEHIRIRYVWMWVGISMVIITTIWIISLAAQNKQTDDYDSLSKKQIMEQFQNQKKSIEDTTGQIKNLQGQSQNNIKGPEQTQEGVSSR